jgi:hypothetical protein
MKRYFVVFSVFIILVAIFVDNLSAYGEMIRIVNAPVLERWIDYASDGFEGGVGTEEDPYLIATPEQLARLSLLTPRFTGRKAYEYERTHSKLVKDIDLAGKTWFPIGRIGGFYGVFDGQGHTIYNLTISDYEGFAGLFGSVGSDATIKNLRLVSICIYGGFISGGIVGVLSASGSKVSNCFVSGTIKGFVDAGGIAGTIFTTKGIYNCDVSADIIRNSQDDFSVSVDRWRNRFDYTSGGGIVGRFKGGALINCHAKVNINSFSRSGGIAGEYYGEKKGYFGSYPMNLLIKDSTAGGTLDNEPFAIIYPTGGL